MTTRGPEPYPPSWYAATAHAAPSHPRLRGAVRADVGVVGAGYTGLSAALHLAERGYKVALVEAQRVGWGASGRNGGQIVTAYACDMAKLERAAGRADARRLFDLSIEAKEILKHRIDRHAIDCGLTWGYLTAALSARQYRGLAEDVAVWPERWGYPHLRLLDRQAMREHLGSERYVGALYDPQGGHLHPLNYALGLGRAAAEAGVAIFEGSQVLAIEPGSPARLRLAEGEVAADFVALCGDAYLGGLAPALRPTLMPVTSYMLATAPLPEALARRLLPSNAAVCDANVVLNYFRLTADRRLLFGGGASYSGLDPADVATYLQGKMVEVFPDLTDIAIDFAWSGQIGITLERSPHFGRLGPNILFAQGFSGQGVALTGLAGRLIAEAIAGQAERFDLIAKLPHQVFPGGDWMRRPLLALGMAWFRLRDALG